ncbi:MAG: hypothetical protein AB8I08_14025 [Sandaracinaceae bacterium]
MEPAPEDKAKRRRGCLIALAVLVGLGLACGGSAMCLGLSAMSNPRVQLGVRAAGAAMEMNQEALQGPGAQSLRDAGCRHAMSYTPAQMARFVDDVGEEAQLSAPTRPLLVCASAGQPPDCAELARVHAEATGGAERVLISTFQADVAAAICTGEFDASGERLRDLDAAETRFVEVVRPRVF